MAVWHMAPCVAYGCGASLLRQQQKTRAAVGITVTQQTATNRLLEGQFRARPSVACNALIPNHCRLRRDWCQATAHWRTE